MEPSMTQDTEALINGGTDIATGTNELRCVLVSGVAVVTLNKPEKKNALGDILTPALRALLPILEADDRVRCILLTGAGNAFCAGGDVSEMGGAAKTVESDRVAALTEKQMTLTHRLYHLKKITIAALPGAAAGAGLSIALACGIINCAGLRFKGRRQWRLYHHSLSKYWIVGRLWCELVSDAIGWSRPCKITVL